MAPETMFPWLAAVQLPPTEQLHFSWNLMCLLFPTAKWNSNPPVDNDKGGIKVAHFHSFSASMDWKIDLLADFLDRWGHGTVAAAICFFEGCLPVCLSGSTPRARGGALP